MSTPNLEWKWELYGFSLKRDRYCTWSFVCVVLLCAGRTHKRNHKGENKMFGIGGTVKEKPESTSRNEFSRELSSRSEDSGQQQKRILIIDDDPDVTMTLGTVLEQYGFKTDTYTNPVLAYKNFKDGLYDLVLLDIKMPIVDGFLLYQKIRKTDNKVKICFLTASEFYYERFRKEHGFGDFKQESFLRKPIEMKDLIDAIKKIVAIKLDGPVT